MINQLSINNLTLFREDNCVIDNISFTVSSGDLILIIGPNGSGKTTILKAVAGLIDSEEGEIAWNNELISNDIQSYYEHMTWISHLHGFKSNLSINDNLAFEAALFGYDHTEISSTIKDLSLIADCHKPFKTLSAGQKKRAALSRLLLEKKPLWLLDEPTSNLDKSAQQQLLDMID
ncbi:MAG: heme ABC exporter ATP-binding protein CcmA, partial [Woeseiaceae bacterium]|nr:heme ABC exporter ATP-binding protein CcmA [Woeseiaceae bacterium]